MAKSLGYVPNRLAQGLRRQRSGIVGFVGDRVATTPYAVRMILGAQEAFLEADQLMVLMDSEGDPELEARQITTLREHQVDGIVYAAMYHRQLDRLPDALRRRPDGAAGRADQRPRDLLGGARRGGRRAGSRGRTAHPRPPPDRLRHQRERHPGHTAPAARIQGGAETGRRPVRPDAGVRRRRRTPTAATGRRTICSTAATGPPACSASTT